MHRQITVAIREWRKENDKLFDVGLNMKNVTERERVFYEDLLTERVSAQGGVGWGIWRKQRKSKKEEDEKKERDAREVNHINDDCTADQDKHSSDDHDCHSHRNLLKDDTLFLWTFSSCSCVNFIIKLFDQSVDVMHNLPSTCHMVGWKGFYPYIVKSNSVCLNSIFYF